MAGRPLTRNKLDSFGIEAVCDWIMDGMTMTAIARKVGVSTGALIAWIAADQDRSARARASREGAAAVHEERAEELINDAADVFELAKAKEQAHHLRWRASKIAPKTYGDKIGVDHSGSVQHELVNAITHARKRIGEADPE